MNAKQKKAFFLIFTFVLILSGCKASLDNKAVTYTESVLEPDFTVDIYLEDKTCNGTTILADNHIRNHPRIIEVDMKGNILWEYKIPQSLSRFNNPGFDVEPLPDNNILFVLPGKGIFEIDRTGETVWSHKDSRLSHDADRLANGNTLYVHGNNDKKSSAQVKEVNHAGQLVWSWHAEDYFNIPPYNSKYNQGWSHTNAVVRLESGNTLVSPRNFNCLVEIAPDGRVVQVIGKDYLDHQHDPQILANGNILVVNHDKPHEILEIDRNTQKIIWRFAIHGRKMWPVRDANQLSNGNILITGSSGLIEITPEKEIVWRLRLKNIPFNSPQDAAALGFYKAERINR